MFATDSTSTSSNSDADVSIGLKITLDSNNNRLIGIGLVNPYGRRLAVAQFIDNERYDNLRSLLSTATLGTIKECYLGIDKLKLTVSEISKINLVLESELIQSVIVIKYSEFTVSTAGDSLSKLVKNINQHYHLFDREQGMSALSLCVNQLKLLRIDTNINSFELISIDLSQYVSLDQPAEAALNLFPAPTDSQRSMSLFGLLDNCKTVMGSRLLRQWLKQPLVSIDAINSRLDIVELFIKDNILRTTIQQSHLKRIPDLEKSIRSFQKNRADLHGIITLYQFSQKLPGLYNLLLSYEGIHRELIQKIFIQPLGIIIDNLIQFNNLVTTTVDMDALAKHQYCVRPEFSPELLEYYTNKERTMNDMKLLNSEYERQLNIKIKLVQSTTGDKEYVFTISRKDESAIRGKSQYILLQALKGGIRWTSSKLSKLARIYNDQSALYESEQSKIVQQAVNVVTSYTPVLEQSNELIALLDLYISLAHTAVNAPIQYTRPVLLDSAAGKFELIGSRHPMLEVQDNNQFISNDLIMNKGVDNVQIITGPNMGGKSTYIRSAGVIALMAQIGCFVPCTSAAISIVDCIMARVGAGDVQLRGVSTFMKEMLEAAAILKSAKSNSLLIIDELGRGTSTYDGFGLAWGISEYIATEVKAFTLFATHFHELTKLSNSCPTVTNRHVTADTSEDSITMLYQVKNGPSDRSFGIHVARIAKFPAAVVELAKSKSEELELFAQSAGEQLNSITTNNSNNSNQSSVLGRKRYIIPADSKLAKLISAIPDNITDQSITAVDKKLAIEKQIPELYRELFGGSKSMKINNSNNIKSESSSTTSSTAAMEM